ncbi:transmembrane protein 126A [Antennarius striatus]|uniref:transmembrane protein 126A n=1 Tax=Antennarius striatus TaxID=241820 RepID=UPI0035B3CD9F
MMSDRTQGTVAGSVTRQMIGEMLLKNLQRLPDLDQKHFQYGPFLLGGTAGLAGLIANSLYRRALNVTQAAITSSLPMAMLPFMTTATLYTGVVSGPLLHGDLNCPTCVLLRGALVGLTSGAMYPILLALPVNLALAFRYDNILKLEKGNTFRFCVDISMPIVKKMRGIILMQVLFGTYLGYMNFESYTKLVHITFAPDREELND